MIKIESWRGSVVALSLLGCACTLSARSSSNAQVHGESQLRPYASLQEVMDGIIDPAADQLWDSVETTVTRDGEQTRQPQTAEEWREVRRKAVTLIEASTLLAMDGRRVSVKPFAAEAAGALDSRQIQQRIAGNRVAFNLFARSLREGARKAVTAIDARDPVALVAAGGIIDSVCEGCHSTFWYPNQVIPPLP
jgi:hypothetical protein